MTKKPLTVNILLTEKDLPFVYSLLEDSKKTVDTQIDRYRIETVQKKIWSGVQLLNRLKTEQLGLFD